MSDKKKKTAAPVVEEKKEKPTPAYLSDNYPYKAVGDPITDLDGLEPTGVLYEIKCPKCEMSIRSQGCNIKSTYEQLVNGNGCIGCGNRALVIRGADTGKAAEARR